MQNELVTFAARFNVAVADAYVLPAVFERCAQMVKLPVRALLSQATYSNNALGEYIAKCAAEVATKDREG